MAQCQQNTATRVATGSVDLISSPPNDALALFVREGIQYTDLALFRLFDQDVRLGEKHR